MRKSTKRISIAFVTTVAILVGSAAFASDWVASTGLNLKASSTSITNGSTVRLYGRLTSSRRACTNFEKVTLYRGTTAIAHTKTDSTGHYSFTRTPHATATYRTKYAGKVTGVHPNSHTCLASRSNNVKVAVH